MLTYDVWAQTLNRYIEEGTTTEAQLARTLLGLVELGNALGSDTINTYMDQRALWLLEEAQQGEISDINWD